MSLDHVVINRKGDTSRPFEAIETFKGLVDELERPGSRFKVLSFNGYKRFTKDQAEGHARRLNDLHNLRKADPYELIYHLDQKLDRALEQIEKQRKETRNYILKELRLVVNTLTSGLDTETVLKDLRTIGENLSTY